FAQAAPEGVMKKPPVGGFNSNSAEADASLQFDFDVHARGQVEFHLDVNRLVGRVHDVHQTLVCADLELVTRRLVDVGRTQDVETLQAGRQGHGTLDDGAGTLGGFNDFSRRLVDQLVVKRLQANADFLLCHDTSFNKER